MNGRLNLLLEAGLAVLMIAALYAVFVYVPTEREMGVVQRIFYFHVSSAIAAFVISGAILMGLALISTGIRIVTKSTDPVTWAINVLQNLFAGISFPVVYLDTIFFPGVSTISWFLPQTWVYHLARLAMLTNASLSDPKVLFEFMKGSVFAVIFLPLGYKILQWGVGKSKREGTLGWY